MYSPLLNTFIFICKLIICISIFVSVNTHHWIRSTDGKSYEGPIKHCSDYGRFCHAETFVQRIAWFFCIIILLNFVFELLNLLLLFKRPRSRINLILEELGILTTLIFVLPAAFVSIAVLFLIRSSSYRQLDWSFYIFLLSSVLSLIELICSLVRVVSYCSDHSFRSNIITYTSNNNHETVRIES